MTEEFQSKIENLMKKYSYFTKEDIEGKIRYSIEKPEFTVSVDFSEELDWSKMQIDIMEVCISNSFEGKTTEEVIKNLTSMKNYMNLLLERSHRYSSKIEKTQNNVSQGSCMEYAFKVKNLNLDLNLIKSLEDAMVKNEFEQKIYDEINELIEKREVLEKNYALSLIASKNVELIDSLNPNYVNIHELMRDLKEMKFEVKYSPVFNKDIKLCKHAERTKMFKKFQKNTELLANCLEKEDFEILLNCFYKEKIKEEELCDALYLGESFELTRKDAIVIILNKYLEKEDIATCQKYLNFEKGEKKELTKEEAKQRKGELETKVKQSILKNLKKASVEEKIVVGDYFYGEGLTIVGCRMFGYYQHNPECEGCVKAEKEIREFGLSGCLESGYNRSYSVNERWMPYKIEEEALEKIIGENVKDFLKRELDNIDNKINKLKIQKNEV